MEPGAPPRTPVLKQEPALACALMGQGVTTSPARLEANREAKRFRPPLVRESRRLRRWIAWPPRINPLPLRRFSLPFLANFGSGHFPCSPRL